MKDNWRKVKFPQGKETETEILLPERKATRGIWQWRGRPRSTTPKLWKSQRLPLRARVPLKISMTFVDEGGLFTQSVRLACRDRIGRKVFCIKGFDGSNRPFTSPPKQMRIIVNQRAVGTYWQYQLGVDSGKQIIMDNLRVQTPGQKYCHFPHRDDYGPGYFAGLLKAAPFVVPRIGSVPGSREGFSTADLEPGNISISMPLTLDQLVGRGFGESLMSAMSPEDRAAQYLVHDLEELSNRITRTEEALAVQTILDNGTIMRHRTDREKEFRYGE